MTIVLQKKSACAALALVVAMACPGDVLAQSGQSNTGTRQPMTCQPTRSQPGNAGQIARMIQCARETNRAGTITILSNIQVEFGSTRKYQTFSDSGFNGIDTSAPVMPLRGSLDRHICVPITHKIKGDFYSADNSGKNCIVVHERKATGACIHTTFGDWTCTMMEAVHPDEWVSNQPPPR